MTANNTEIVEFNDNEEATKEEATPPSDRANMALLILLYCLQGIPLAVSVAIPMILASRNVNYMDQAIYSFAGWPFTFKLIWAPVLDSVYLLRFGRRKSWMIPAQYLIGLTMLYMAFHMDDWMSTSNGATIQIVKMTVFFFILNFLSATQDVAVDGWSLTMLHRKNIGYAPTCNSVGRSIGYFFGFILLTALESSNFCNTYLRSSPQPYGVLTIAQFLFYISFIYIFVTTLVAVFKHETTEHTQDISMKSAYICLFKVLKLPSVQWLTLICVTVPFANCFVFSMSKLKLIEAGVSQEKIALSALPIMPLKICSVFMLSRWAAGSNGLLKFKYTLYLYFIYDIVTLFFLWYTPALIKDGVPLYFWGLLLVNSYTEAIFYWSGQITLVAFFAKVSDPKFGATYMTLLNTVFDFGWAWPKTLTLSIMDSVTWKECSFNSSPAIIHSNKTNYCLNDEDKKLCQNDAGVCKITFDGFYVLAPICIMFSMVWLMCIKNKFYYLQNLDASKWALSKTYIKVPLKTVLFNDVADELAERNKVLIS